MIIKQLRHNNSKEVSKSPIWVFNVEDNFNIKEILTSNGELNDNKKLSVMPPPAGCVNSNLELGNFQGWDGYYGSRSGSSSVNLNSLSNGIVPGRHTIRQLSDGFDPIVGGNLLPQVSEGNYSIRLGNNSGGAQADVIKYTFTVNAQNQRFSFKYAVVLQDPNHNAGEQPFFTYYLLKGSSILFSSSNLPIAGKQVLADASNPFFKGANGVIYREWTPVCIDLSKYIGETMTIVFVTADCSFTQHFGYAYIDGLCDNNDAVPSFTMPNQICLGQSLIVDGTASLNETSYFWSIEESDANAGRPNPSSEVSGWVVAQQAGLINYSSLYNSKGKSFKCNTYYRIKLAVNNDCSPWNELVKLLFVKCPAVTAGIDRCVSCTSNGSTVQLGQGNSTDPSLTYAWSPSTGLSNPNSPSPNHMEGGTQYPITYTVTVTDGNGCTNTDQVSLFCRKPTLAISSIRNCCDYTLIANAQNHTSLIWSTGQSNVSSITINSGGTYTVTASNPCGQVSQTITIPSANFMVGPFNQIAYNSKFYPPSGGGGLSDKLYIKDVITGNGAKNIPNSYNATKYELRIYNRWGQLFRTIKGSSCNGFNNWDINWDGRDANGNLVPQDVYNWQLRLENCQYTCMECQCPIERKFVDLTCVDCGGLPGPGCKWYNHCKKWNVPPGTTVDVPICVGSVTVIR
ncbi:MAG TPA: hypothetical protein VK168_02140 [Saprospiraceae bacterium]|nr:hypothetical protein [Saprospiraceae bacterium]